VSIKQELARLLNTGDLFNQLQRHDQIKFYSHPHYRVGECELQIPLKISPYDVFDLKSDVKFFWRAKDDTIFYVGIGKLLDFDELDLRHFPEGLRGLKIFGGVPFRATKKVDWLELNRPLFFLPKLEWSFDGDQVSLKIRQVVIDDESFDDLKARLKRTLIRNVEPAMEANHDWPENVVVKDEPSEAEWRNLIGSAKDSIQSKQFAKVVLARTKKIQLEEELAPGLILKRLGDVAENSYLFSIMVPSGMAFLGKSPERFLSWQGNDLRLEILAGTVKEGEGEAELRSEKNSNEHAYVTSYVEEQLKGFCNDFHLTHDRTKMDLAYVSHMRSAYKGLLKSGSNVWQLLAALFPNPAVGGYPKDQALAFINQNESIDRGWYAGLIGWTDGVRGDFALGIRSASLYGSTLKVYGGAGIVGGSEAELEWRETEMKMNHFLHLFDINHGG
jgi:menaquinone-specific isochorismate synthase